MPEKKKMNRKRTVSPKPTEPDHVTRLEPETVRFAETPPLPDLITQPNPLDTEAPRQDAAAMAMDASFPGGCYLLKYTPSGVAGVHYDGTLRVQDLGAFNYLASGDLYLHNAAMPPAEPNPAGGIPVLPRGRYRYYIRVIAIRMFPFDGSVRPTFELHRFNAATRTWTNEGQHVAVMVRRPAPPAYPFPGQYFEGTVFRLNGTVTGSMTMGLVSKMLRRATIEIDRVAVSEPPVDNGSGVNWSTVGGQVGWDLTVIQSNADVAEPSGASWSDAEMHAAMLARRDFSNLDVEWRYHILAVRNIDSTPRGIMYDVGGTDSNNVPREGIGIASHWIIPNTNDWGLVKGMRFGTAKKPYYRTAVHEIGHAMGLYHNTVDLGFMNTTDVIAASGTLANPFPNNIKWAHATDDQKRLRHMPDIYVRPGGLPFGTAYGSVPISDQVTDAESMNLTVEPLTSAVPIGAPVRVNITLSNDSGGAIEAPASLGMKAGFVRGTVTDPAGTARTFMPVVLCVDEEPLAMLEPGGKIQDSITLMRGAAGALFPMPGLYKVSVEVVWGEEGAPRRVAGAAPVMVTAPVDDAHARAASKVLSTPDALLAMVFGGDHLEDGVHAIEAGLSHEVLRPHFAFIEAKRLGQDFGGRKADLKACAELINESTVMSAAELERAAKLVKKTGAGSATGKQIAKILKSKMGKLGARQEVQDLVDSL